MREATVGDDVRVRLVRLHEDGDADLDPGTFEAVRVEGRVRRRWVLAPIGCPDSAGVNGISIRATSRADDEAMADVLTRASAGTIDFDPSDDHHKELEV